MKDKKHQLEIRKIRDDRYLQIEREQNRKVHDLVVLEKFKVKKYDYKSEIYLQSSESCTKRDIMKNLKLPGICIYTDKSTECLQEESKAGKAARGSEANRAVQDSCTSQYMLSHDQTFIHISAS